MYHRNYTTYLHKELDFLKQLVSRFHEHEHLNDLELVVAMQKTQDIYEHFLKIKMNIKSWRTDTAEQNETESFLRQEFSAIIEQQQQIAQPQPIPQPQPQPIPQPIPQVIAYEQEEGNTVKKDKKLPQKQQPETPKASILAEKLSSPDFQPINETMAQQTEDLSSKLQAAPIDSISSSIGLNDRFLYMRELFNGDNDLYKRTVKYLDYADSFEEAIDFISTHFDWNNSDETARKFISLIHRRHIGN